MKITWIIYCHDLEQKKERSHVSSFRHAFPINFHRGQVAAKIVRGVKRGDFCISVGMDGYLLALGTQGFSPCFSVGEAIMQVSSVYTRRCCRTNKLHSGVLSL